MLRVGIFKKLVGFEFFVKVKEICQRFLEKLKDVDNFFEYELGVFNMVVLL